MNSVAKPAILSSIISLSQSLAITDVTISNISTKEANASNVNMILQVLFKSRCTFLDEYDGGQ